MLEQPRCSRRSLHPLAQKGGKYVICHHCVQAAAGLMLTPHSDARCALWMHHGALGSKGVK